MSKNGYFKIEDNITFLSDCVEGTDKNQFRLFHDYIGFSGYSLCLKGYATRNRAKETHNGRTVYNYYATEKFYQDAIACNWKGEHIN